MRRAHDTAVHMDAHIAGAVDHTPAYTVGIHLPRDKPQNMYVDRMLKFDGTEHCTAHFFGCKAQQEESCVHTYIPCS